MSDYTQAQVLQTAAIVSLTDDALQARIDLLRHATEDDWTGCGDDNLTGAGWVELQALEDEQAKRRPAMVLCPCCRGRSLRPGTICANCAAWPLD